MKKIFVVVLTFILSNRLSAQDHLPCYLEMAREFFTHYSRDTSEWLFFLKKKGGWYVKLTDAHNDSVKSEQLFWDIREKKYNPLTGFGPGISAEETEKKIAERIKDDDSPFFYGLERCRYYGYDDWDIDMIEDFGNSIPANDTLLEGLARAYDTYGQRYLSYTATLPPDVADPLKKKLYKSERPGKEKLDQFLFYVNKAAECNRILAERNPGYKLLVGTSGMKFINEHFLLYQQLVTYGYTKEAKQVMNNMPANDIYHQIGRMYLNSCPPNSILITYGDNDTYGTWYVQEKEGFRKDVTVLNYQLLGTMPYLDMLRKNKKVLFSMPGEFFTKINGEYVRHYEDTGKPGDISQPLPALIKDLYQVKYPFITNGDTVATYKTKTIVLDVDLNRLKKISNRINLASTMIFELNYYMYLSDLAILDILEKNLYTRPVCCTSPLPLFQKDYLQHEGAVYRILPLADLADDKIRIETSKIQGFLTRNYKPVIVSYGKQLNEYEEILNGMHMYLFAELINNYIKLKNPAKAKEWAAKYLAHPDMKKLAPHYGHLKIIDVLLNTGYTKEAMMLVESLAGKLVYNYSHYSSLELFQSKEDLVYWLDYLKLLLNTKNETSDKLQKMIDDLK